VIKYNLKKRLNKTTRTFFHLLPIIIGMLLLTSLAVTLFPEQISAGLFGDNDVLNVFIGASLGGVAVGNPMASYLLGGELLNHGVSLLVVTAFMVSWVTVGIVQLPSEALILGMRFTLYRNVLCFCSALAVSFLTVYTLKFLG